ncbi:MAG: DUF4276 family protein [Planctomycetaceae bacterium]|nr:DUF4276 family protein [Planctomycetaceae bacterium]
MIVFLTEEKSMQAMLGKLMSAHWPDATAGVDWIALKFEGKNDLDKNVAAKIQSWNFGTPHFIILRDQDGRDCRALKQALYEKAKQGGKPFTVRIVCNELESWLLGDLDAVEGAYPSTKAGKQKNVAKFRDPDALSNANQELENLVKVKGKVGRATTIATLFSPARCTPHSFQVFWRTTTQLMNRTELDC